MGDEKVEKVDVAALKAQVEQLTAQLKTLSGAKNTGKGDGRVVEEVSEDFTSLASDIKDYHVRAGNVQSKDGPVPGVIGIYVGKSGVSNRGKKGEKRWNDGGVFIQAADVDKTIAALVKVRESAKQKGYF